MRQIIGYAIFFLFLYGYSECNKNNDNTPNNGNLDKTFAAEKQKPSLTPEQKIQQEKEILYREGWEENNMQNGVLPNCYNFKPKRGQINNYLDVYVGSGTDVAIKLINLESNQCVRYVFINSGTYYSIRNIPEGKYYIKIAYGKNWLSKTESGYCIGKFIRNPIYDKGTDIMDFNIQNTFDGYSIPSFKLQLDIVSNDRVNSFDSHNISENEFNQ